MGYWRRCEMKFEDNCDHVSRCCYTFYVVMKKFYTADQPLLPDHISNVGIVKFATRKHLNLMLIIIWEEKVLKRDKSETIWMKELGGVGWEGSVDVYSPFFFLLHFVRVSMCQKMPLPCRENSGNGMRTYKRSLYVLLDKINIRRCLRQHFQFIFCQIFCCFWFSCSARGRGNPRRGGALWSYILLADVPSLDTDLKQAENCPLNIIQT